MALETESFSMKRPEISLLLPKVMTLAPELRFMMIGRTAVSVHCTAARHYRHNHSAHCRWESLGKAASPKALVVLKGDPRIHSIRRAIAGEYIDDIGINRRQGVVGTFKGAIRVAGVIDKPEIVRIARLGVDCGRAAVLSADGDDFEAVDRLIGPFSDSNGVRAAPVCIFHFLPRAE